MNENNSNPNISIVTGTLNRKRLLPRIIKNTVEADSRLELVLVDGGSTDGTQKYLHKLNHPRIKLIDYGQRSSYPHFMNLGIQHASHNYICQWNDDCFLVNPWSDVFDEIDSSEVYIFSWKKDRYPRFKDKDWILVNTKDKEGEGEVVVNYGIYHKDVYRRIGLYHNGFYFYCADGDMAQRAWHAGIKIKNCWNIKVIALKGVPKSRSYNLSKDWERYQAHIALYRSGRNPEGIEHLTS